MRAAPLIDLVIDRAKRRRDGAQPGLQGTGKGVNGRTAFGGGDPLPSHSGAFDRYIFRSVCSRVCPVYTEI